MLCIIMEIEELISIGQEVVAMLKEKKFSEIAEQYDYALKYDQEAEAAIKNDFLSSLKECIGSIENSNTEITIKKFEENTTGLDTLIECDIPLEQNTGILVEIILSTKGSIYLEQISSYKTENNA